MVDNVPSKKRQHDAIEQDFNPMVFKNIYIKYLTNGFCQLKQGQRWFIRAL